MESYRSQLLTGATDDHHNYDGEDNNQDHNYHDYDNNEDHICDDDNNEDRRDGDKGAKGGSLQ